MRTLHVAALPYPSPQGTQGLLHAMLTALGAHGHDTHLLCYAHGAGDLSGPYTVHRVQAQSRTGSLRSGPSLDKLRLDVSLAARLSTLGRTLAPDLVIAHHVEAALCALAVGASPVFVAHTSLREELPSYFAPRLAPALRALGGGLDALLTRCAARTYAVSPLLATLLARESGRGVSMLPLPWPLAPVPTRDERAEARRSLGLACDDEVALYAGNLDAYQGIDALVDALAVLARTRPRLRWLVATSSPHDALAARIASHGLGARTLFVRLDDERDRRRVHAAADLALVPRASAGGIPIKLLDALARGLPCVVSEHALAGLPLAAHCTVVRHATERAWCDAIASVLATPAHARMKGLRGRAYVADALASRRFVAVLETEHARCRSERGGLSASASRRGAARG